MSNNKDQKTVDGFGDKWERFGTRLEQRFIKKQIRIMMQDAGLTKISFSEENPYWVAVGYREKV
ncbi:MAG TPA: hypothetical protein DCS80_05020 [Betaproteobacteria bacterium]|nr:hypothetical protein [Betaproteobacteria bacterium]